MLLNDTDSCDVIFGKYTQLFLAFLNLPSMANYSGVCQVVKIERKRLNGCKTLSCVNLDVPAPPFRGIGSSAILRIFIWRSAPRILPEGGTGRPRGSEKALVSACAAGFEVSQQEGDIRRSDAADSASLVKILRSHSV